MSAEQARAGGLLGLGVLFSKAWQVFKQRAKVLVPLYLISVLLPLVLASPGPLIRAFLPELPAFLFWILLPLGVLGGGAMMLWAQAALFVAVSDEEAGLKESFGRTKTRVGSYLGLVVLWNFLVFGGSLIFVIPGIVLFVWFFAAFFIFASEQKTGFEALQKSRAYVRGYGLGVFGRLIILLVFFGLWGMVPYLQFLIPILVGPVVLIYMAVIYQNLKALKDPMPFEPSPVEKKVLAGVGAAGIVWAVGAGFMLWGSHLPRSAQIFLGERLGWQADLGPVPQGTLPPRVGGFSASKKGDVLKLRWQPAPGATGYLVYRQKDGKAWKKITPQPITATRVAVKGIQKGSVNKFYVIAVKGGVRGPPSQTVALRL